MKILKYLKTHFLKYFMKLLIFNIKWLKTFKNMIKVYQVSRRYIMLFMHNNKLPLTGLLTLLQWTIHQAGKKHCEIFLIFQRYFMKYFMKFYITNYVTVMSHADVWCCRRVWPAVSARTWLWTWRCRYFNSSLSVVALLLANSAFCFAIQIDSPILLGCIDTFREQLAIHFIRPIWPFPAICWSCICNVWYLTVQPTSHNAGADCTRQQMSA